MIEFNINNLEKLSFDKDIITIGRVKGFTDIAIESIKISRNHCEVFKKDSLWYIKDVGSTNGTYLNNELLEANKEYILKDSDIIVIGTSGIKVILDDEEETNFSISDSDEEETNFSADDDDEETNFSTDDDDDEETNFSTDDDDDEETNFSRD